MKPYLDVLSNVYHNGKLKADRTGVGTKYIFSEKFRCDLRDGFPLLTTKKINFSKVAGELFGFLTGADTIQKFQEFDCNIWDPWGLKEDYYQLVRLSPAKYAEALAEKTNIPLEEAQLKLDQIEADFNDWNRRYSEFVQEQVATGILEIPTDQPTEAMDPVNEFLMSKPPTIIEFLQSQDVPVFVKDIIYEEGYLGPIYGKQWLEWKTSTGHVINQLKNLANQLENNPFSRRKILTGWNPEVVPADKYFFDAKRRPVTNSEENIQAAILDGKQALPPCHLLVVLNTYVSPDDPQPVLNLHLTMRSTDVPIGLPFNIASYALLLSIIAHQFDMVAGELVIEMVDCHIYKDQLDLVPTQLNREPGQLPRLELPHGIYFDDPSTLTRENFEKVVAGLKDYNPQPFIKYPVAV